MKKQHLLALCAASLSALSAQPLLAQPAWNNGFEAGMQGWTQPVITPLAGQKPGVNKVGITTTNVRSGKQAIQFEVGSWSPAITFRSELQTLIAGESYQQVRLWQKYEGPLHRKFGARVQLYDANRAPITGSLFNREGTYIPDGDWYPLTIFLDVPKEAKFYTVELYWANGNGKLAFDDIVLSAIPAPVAVKTGYSLPALSNAERDLWVALPQEKIYPTATKPLSTGGAVRIAAARGESHSMQLVYQPKAAQTGLAVTPGALKGTTNGKSLPASVIEAHYVADVQVKDNIQQFGKGGPTPDPLYPAPPQEVPAGKPQSIWLTARVPRDAAPGNYQGTVRVKTGQSEIEVPLQLEVYDFALPEKPALHTNAASQGIEPSSRDNLRQRLRANRIFSEISYGGGVQSLAWKLNPDNTVTIDFAAWDPIMEKYMADGMTGFFVPRIQFGSISGIYRDGLWYYNKEQAVKYGTPEWRKAVGSFAKQMHDHLEEKGWLEHAVWEIWDEPMGNAMRATVRDIAALIRENAPKAKIMVTGWPVAPADPNIDIWCPQHISYEPRMRNFTKGEFWSYHNNLYLLDLPHNLSNMRAETWWLWDNDITGLLWWSITYGWRKDLVDHLSPYPRSNGNGFLFYPGQDGDTSKVNDSIRVAVYRGAVNDYDYFTLLARAQDKAVKSLKLEGKAPTGKQLVQVFLKQGLATKDPNMMEKIRQFTAELIAFTGKHPNVALKAGPHSHNTKNLQGFAKPGSSIKLGSRTVKVGADGTFQFNLANS